MAPSPLRSKTKKHTRSSSFPSRPQPVVPQFNEHLTILRGSEVASSSLTNRMNSIGSLYDCIDDLLQLPYVQHAMSQECQEKWVDNLLDVYLRILNACATTKDILVSEKQNLQNLLSAIRRRRDTDDISGYLTSTRKAEKIIHKSLKALSSIKNKENVVILENHETVAVINMQKQVESVTLAMFESFLSNFLAINTQ
ncbi:uncharacterized protein LOC116028914 [Ipomoea triloba]|uniref:uncharacterized protein LOC116028914 n=1 Tax=Ipomoea triloba TaxID=35885 RepID=UPI00125D80E8|nr:uncharacterized protein LOC116028914 [Ipomoea triloba]